jgi:hypothetical protein
VRASKQQPIVSRTYRAAPDYCARALELLLVKAVHKEGVKPDAHDDVINSKEDRVSDDTVR